MKPTPKQRKQLMAEYEAIAMKYINIFCRKQDMTFEGWVGMVVGEVAVCNDFFFNSSDILLDIHYNSPKGEIIKWYNDNDNAPCDTINYYSYIKGLRVSDL